MQVLKFGGTSVANSQCMSGVIEIVSNSSNRDRTIVVLSAISGCTNTLISIGEKAAARDKSYKLDLESLELAHRKIINDLLPSEKYEEANKVCTSLFESLKEIAKGVCLLGELSNTSLDAIQSYGELLSTKIFATKLASIGISTKWIDSRSIIKTEVINGKSVVNMDKTYNNIEEMIEHNPITNVFVVPGFIASDEPGKTTTLGRGGSDYTASLYAVGAKARTLEIWTDVPGIMTTNPKIVPTASLINNISYRAALELSHFGAKVIYPPTIQPVVANRIPIYVKNTFTPEEEGTLIENNPPTSKTGLVGISNSDNIALISLEGSEMVGIPGFSSRLFATLSQNDINIILITQASSVHTMCVAVSEADADKAKMAADKCFAYEISLGKLNPLKVEKGFSIVCLVGDNMLNQYGASGRMFAALNKQGITIRATAQGSSERNISVIINSSDTDEAIKEIHREFFDKTATQRINLFIAGYGVVGKALVEIISQNSDKIKERTGKRLRVIGLSNSKRYVINKAGIDLTSAQNLLENGKSAADEAFFLELGSLSFENSIFIDCTASSDIAYKYMNLFKSGYSVVACNKISFSAPYNQYKFIKETALENGKTLRYETTVGAALPMLETISRCANSGDDICKIEAVLSGTLNYIFSTYKGGNDGFSFANVVKKAQDAGYTEPDPSLDLSGKDVLRKLLILSREAGVPLEESDVDMSPILGPEYLDCNIQQFYNLLEKNEAYFSQTYKDAESKGLRQRFIASLERKEDGQYVAKLGLQNVDNTHPLYNLSGTDNCAIIKTDFYPSPLVVQGAGAGAKQTASGLLNDILL